MKACVLRAPALIETNPLEYAEVATPQPKAGEVLVRVRACGVCRTDLHVIEGQLPPRKSPLIPGHQVVGVIEKRGEGARRFAAGARVGIAWLHRTDGTCEYCRAGVENLCDNPMFTGYTVDGGYAEFIVAPEDFAYAIPEGIPDEQAAPLLWAGFICTRSHRLATICCTKSDRLGAWRTIRGRTAKTSCAWRLRFRFERASRFFRWTKRTAPSMHSRMTPYPARPSFALASKHV